MQHPAREEKAVAGFHRHRDGIGLIHVEPYLDLCFVGLQRVAALDRDLRSSGIDVMNIDPTRSVVEPLLAFFRMREKRARR